MTSVIVRRLVWCVSAAFLVGLVAGCSNRFQGPGTMSEGQKHILKALQLAQEYRNKNKTLPPSIDELKKFAKTIKPERLKEIGIEDLDDAFISPRDKQPYVLAKPAANDMQAKMGMMAVLFYEKEGVGGKHLTVSSMGSTNELTREQLKGNVADFPG